MLNLKFLALKFVLKPAKKILKSQILKTQILNPAKKIKDKF